MGALFRTRPYIVEMFVAIFLEDATRRSGAPSINTQAASFSYPYRKASALTPTGQPAESSKRGTFRHHLRYFRLHPAMPHREQIDAKRGRVEKLKVFFSVLRQKDARS